jgi:hypothetical protein
MSNEGMRGAKVSGKGEKARNSVIAAWSDIETVQAVLGRIVEVYKFFDMIQSKKMRSMVEGVPARIEFEENGLRLYVDFTLQTANNGEGPDVEGVIIYGTSRTLCFKEWPFPEQPDVPMAQKAEDRKCCDRITRCDGLEDKPLLRYMVNRHGRIRSAEIDDEWWIVPLGTDDTKNKKLIKENQETLADLHYRAIDRIWSDAVDWTNEKILP